MADSAAVLEPCNCLAARKAARHLTQFYDRHLAPSGLRSTQFSVLARVRLRGPISINALAAELALDRTTLGRTLRPLERDGLIRLGRDPRDRRGRALTLTAAGEARLDAARPLWLAAQRRFEAVYGEQRAGALRQTLAELVAVDLPCAGS